MEKSKNFEWELSQVKNDRLREVVRDYFENVVPDYFWTIPASTTGKYHPDIDLGEGGLVRHTKMVVRVAVELLGITMFSSLRINSDCIIAALLVHDTMKCGEGEKYSRHDHPILASVKFMEHSKKYQDFDSTLKLDTEIICKMVESHMGQWTTSAYSPIILPEPTTRGEKFVHLCDYIASRKFIGKL